MDNGKQELITELRMSLMPWVQSLSLEAGQNRCDLLLVAQDLAESECLLNIC